MRCIRAQHINHSTAGKGGAANAIAAMKYAVLWAAAAWADIPKRLITSHKLPLDETPAALKRNIEEWRTLNPEMEFTYFDDAAQAAWMADAARPRAASRPTAS